MSNEATMFAIRDRKTGEFYQSVVCKTGWYGDLGMARLFKTQEGALGTINKAGHHVKYPGDRMVHVVKVRLEAHG